MSNFTHLDELLKGYIKRGLPGCGMVVAKEGKTLYEGFHGLMDIEKNLPVTDETLYRMCSLSKIVTCTAGLILMERGKFLLNDPLYEYLPEYKHHIVAKKGPDGKYTYEDSKGPMLVRHAFMMAVGLPNPTHPQYSTTPTVKKTLELREDLSKGKYNLRQFIRELSNVPIACEPGERFMYGLGHDILAAMIEVISGKTFGQFLKEEIFEPLGMESTGHRLSDKLPREKLVSIYDVNDFQHPVKITNDSHDTFYDPNAIYESGGAGLLSTAKDYIKFTQMLANGGKFNNHQIIGHRTIDLMRKNHMNEVSYKEFQNFYNKGYGYGLGVRTLVDPVAAGSNNHVGAFGWSGVLGLWTEMYPEEGFSAVYMHQTVPNNEPYHHLRVRSVIYGAI